ncbi:MAG: flagellar basal body P-ring formation protein FlgA [Desulfosarcina sp.]|nr:flagellar basal body P-ring formation protein FlgA [Desulfosarcina sp.]MBC2742069.1 flagellar basal body P-ring formation protein FlgA [Desulfosarcina sp.]MBC2764982.1 flagellar basal body P-ring formation protein FlgA [Desulfosarcina sp.]
MRANGIQRYHCTRELGVCLILMFVVFLSSPAAFSSDGICLTLKAAVAVDQAAIRLSDIATLTGASEMQLKTLGATVVARSPQPGQIRFVGIDYIRIRLKQAGADTASMIFKGPQDVRITRQAAKLPIRRIERAVETAIRSRMPWKNEDVTISGITFDETIHLPTGKLSYRIVPNRNEDYLGRTILALHLFVDGEPVRKVWVNATISVMADVVTAIRPLGKHQHIELADLSVERRDLVELPSDTVSRIEDALGNRATRMIYPGSVLQSSMISSPPLVKRGDIVKIIANIGSMTITATGMVKQQGRKGEMVRVVNTDSRRIITARVTGPGAVAVDF